MQVQNVHSYSCDMLKKAAFVDELNNILNLLPNDIKIFYDLEIIKSYIENRIKEIDLIYESIER